MEHIQPFKSRTLLPLPTAKEHGWQLKRYAIVANGRTFESDITSAALVAAYQRLPAPGSLTDSSGNHGVGFQIIHFAEVAVVSPVFYWQWGSVLANAPQMRAQWDAPTGFNDGVKEVVACVWEMEIIAFEVNAWKNTILGNAGLPAERLAAYLALHPNEL